MISKDKGSNLVLAGLPPLPGSHNSMAIPYAGSVTLDQSIGLINITSGCKMPIFSATLYFLYGTLTNMVAHCSHGHTQRRVRTLIANFVHTLNIHMLLYMVSLTGLM